MLKGDDNGLKPAAGPLGTPCTALFQFVASTKVHPISLRSPCRFGYLIFQRLWLEFFGSGGVSKLIHYTPS